MVHLTAITIPEEIHRHIAERRKKKEVFNFSNFCARAYQERFMQEDAIIKEHNLLMGKVMELRKQIESIKQQKKKEEKDYFNYLQQNPNLEKLEYRFLVSAKRKILEDEKFFNPIYQRYINTFRYISKPKFKKKVFAIDLKKCINVPDYEEQQQTGSKTIV